MQHTAARIITIAITTNISGDTGLLSFPSSILNLNLIIVILVHFLNQEMIWQNTALHVKRQGTFFRICIFNKNELNVHVQSIQTKFYI